MILRDTPIEKHDGIYVKREDLCVPPGAPPFSKIRGLVKHLEKLKQEGYKGAAYVETSVSMAGWGVAWACAYIGLKCIIFNPVYKKPIPLLLYHRQQWKKYGAEIKDVPAGRAKVNYYIARKQLPNGYRLLPLGLPLPETVAETCRIAAGCVNEYASVVICVGSGTIASGVYRAMDRPDQIMYGVMSRAGNIRMKSKRITGGTLAGFDKKKLKLVDVGWEYAAPSQVKTPFPCHPWYDAKAWEWLMENKKDIKPPVLFWNIGSTGEYEGEVK